jgi:ribosomal protein S18 acetylase RimI-like enzyme
VKETIIIRDFEISDTKAVILLAQELQSHERKFENRFKPENEVGIAHLDSIRTEVAKYKGRFLVACSEDVVIAFAALHLEVVSDDETTFVHHIYSNVEYIVVSKLLRGRGIGKLLLNECEKLALNAGSKYLQLSVIGGNNEARRFYFREGFEEISTKMEKKLK